MIKDYSKGPYCRLRLYSKYRNAYVFQVLSMFKEYYICWISNSDVFYTRTVPQSASDLYFEYND
jgi:hypothetical protein